MIFLLVAGAVIAGAPIAGALLVTIASLREDAKRSLSGRPPGLLEAAARRLLCAGPSRVTDQYLIRPGSARVPQPRRAPDTESADRTLAQTPS